MKLTILFAQELSTFFPVPIRFEDDLKDAGERKSFRQGSVKLRTPGHALHTWPLYFMVAAIVAMLGQSPLKVHAQAQITAEQLANLQPVDPSLIPTNATYWEWFYGTGSTQPVPAPVPRNPFGPEVPVYNIEGHYFICNGPDDLNLFQQQRQLQADMGMLRSMDENGGIDQPDGATPLDAAFAPGTFYICSITVTGQVINLVLTNTVQDVWYEIQSKNALTNTSSWVSETSVWGLSNSTPVALWVGNRTNQLWLRAISWGDSSGSGIPDWWMMKYFGPDLTAWPDADADLNSDGHTVIEAYRNDWNPHVSHTPPPPPQSVATTVDSTGTHVTITWASGGGPVTSYVVERAADGNPEDGVDLLGTNNPASVSFTDIPGRPLSGTDLLTPIYRVRAWFGTGISSVSDWEQVYTPHWAVQVEVVRGPGGQYYLAVPCLPPSATAIHIFSETPDPNNPDFYIGTSNVVNGLVPLTFQQVATFIQTDHRFAQAVSSNGSTFGQVSPFFFRDAFHEEVGSLPRTNLFVNASVQLKQNLRFLLRGATLSFPFSYASDVLTDGHESSAHADDPTRPENNFSRPPSSTDYEYYGFRTFSTNLNFSVLQEVRPVYENSLWRNFAYDHSNPTWGTGVFFDYTLNDEARRTLSTPFDFQYTGAGAAPLPNLLANPTWPYLGYVDFFLGEAGFGYDNDGNGVVSPVQNCYGLQLNSLYLSDLQSGVQLFRQPNGSIDASYFTTNTFSVFPEFAEPDLRTNGYYFVSQTAFLNTSYGPNPALPPPIPGSPDFSVDTQTPLFIAAFGQPFSVSGWAKLQIANGYPGKFAYLEQYFDTALSIGTNGAPTSTSAGLLSPYGEFFPTMPGPAALVTLPDLDPPYQRGTGVVNVIKLQLDVNHDGTMDLSFGGPDNTSSARPMVWWVNNDRDWSWITSDPGHDVELPETNGISYLSDCTDSGIYSQRDLEDFARLWICGIPVLTNGNYQVSLSWGTIFSGSPAINLFPAAETNGGYAYLTNLTTARAQVAGAGSTLLGAPSVKLATVSPTQPFTSLVNFCTNNAPKYFLFEGAGIGKGQLLLTISQITPEGTNIIAQTGAWLDLHDVKDFYERMVITNNVSGAVSNWTSGIEKTYYASESGLGDDKELILLVHGINVTRPDWLIESDTVFKRLYWAGYHGKFATVKWPCEFFKLWTLFNLDTQVFNRSEIKAYKAASALKAYLDDLHVRFAGYHIHLMVHSQGNSVVSEAIEQGATFDTYVLTQAALPASSYDVNAAFHTGLTNTEAIHGPTPEWRLMGYRGAYTNMTGRIVNFYNPKDPVLDIWVSDQGAAKPNLPSTDYHYDGTTATFQPPFGSSYIVTDPQESRAFVSRSRTLPIGQSGPESSHGVLQSALNLNTKYGFNDSFPDDHSAQWAWPIQTTRPYFQELLRRCQLEPAP